MYHLFTYLVGYIRVSSILHQNGHDISVVIYGSNLQGSVTLEININNNNIKAMQ